MVADRGSHQADAIGFPRDCIEHHFFGYRSHPAVGASAASRNSGNPANSRARSRSRTCRDSSVCGVRIALCAGKSASSQAATAGSTAPWCSGTKTSGEPGQRGERLASAGGAVDRLEHGLHELLRLTHHDRIDERRKRQADWKRSAGRRQSRTGGWGRAARGAPGSCRLRVAGSDRRSRARKPR